MGFSYEKMIPKREDNPGGVFLVCREDVIHLSFKLCRKATFYSNDILNRDIHHFEEKVFVSEEYGSRFFDYWYHIDWFEKPPSLSAGGN